MRSSDSILQCQTEFARILLRQWSSTTLDYETNLGLRSCQWCSRLLDYAIIVVSLLGHHTLVLPDGNHRHDNRGTDGCDRPFRSINNVTEILRARKMNDLLADMKLHYSDPAGHNELVWRNEWNQHGTCVQTLQQYCYTAYETGLDVQNFFQTEMALFRSRPTYGILAAAEAIPQFHEKYKFSIIHKAVSDFHGADVTMHCDSKGHLYAIDYHYEQYGCFAFGSFVPKKFNGKWINHCPPEIVYYPKVAKKAAST